jgi:glutamate--glyoxylate aminotransferase
MVPIPQYPLYSALLTLEGGLMVKYYLEEEKNWGINASDIIQRI